jgi:hypothetical protein
MMKFIQKNLDAMQRYYENNYREGFFPCFSAAFGAITPPEE